MEKISRIARKPVTIPEGVEVHIQATEITVKGKSCTLSCPIHPSVQLVQEQQLISVSILNPGENGNAHAGTIRAMVANMMEGVSKGFEKKLELVGVGYRAKLTGKKIDLSLGFSHPVSYTLPESVNATVPKQTEIVLTSPDRQLLGQVASEIRRIRPPEPYKGKGVRYAGEHIVRKEGKKK